MKSQEKSHLNWLSADICCSISFHKTSWYYQMNTNNEKYTYGDCNVYIIYIQNQNFLHFIFFWSWLLSTELFKGHL